MHLSWKLLHQPEASQFSTFCHIPQLLHLPLKSERIGKPVFRKTLFRLVLLTISASAATLSSAQEWRNWEQVSRPEVAASVCAQEWENLVTIAPDTWSDTALIGIDPSLDDSTTYAFNKWAVAVMALADYTGTFLGLADAPGKRRQDYNEARIRYDLASCLFPTQAEREAILAFSVEHTSKPREELTKKLFGPFDLYKCMGLVQASEQVFQLAPDEPSFATDVQRIVSSTMKACS